MSEAHRFFTVWSPNDDNRLVEVGRAAGFAVRGIGDEEAGGVVAYAESSIADEMVAKLNGERPESGPVLCLSVEERAQRLLDGRKGWNAEVINTGGGVEACAVESTIEVNEAPYAWITESEDEGKPYDVGVYLPHQEEAVSMRGVSEAELESYVFVELARVAENEGPEG
jgi:hypothetical protein